MISENKMKVSFPSRSVNEAFARTVVAAFVAAADPTVDELCDIRTAVSEAVTNCIVHGYRDTLGTIYISGVMYPGGRVVIKIKDNGCGIENIKQAMEPLFTTCKSGERAGLGFAVMEELMDKVKVRSIPGKGTTVIMERIIKSKQ
ncbi:MAG: anti-sigma F factor [Angelakisella sp.]|nr:anti-sigma F factor [Angelakisella sp.]